MLRRNDAVCSEGRGVLSIGSSPQRRVVSPTRGGDKATLTTQPPPTKDVGAPTPNGDVALATIRYNARPSAYLPGLDVKPREARRRISSSVRIEPRRRRATLPCSV